MELMKFTDIPVGGSILNKEEELIHTLIERINKDLVKITAYNPKGGDVVLQYTQTLSDGIIKVLEVESSFWHIILDGNFVKSIDVNKFSNIEIKQITPRKMSIELES